jgi:hypothetical protein
MASLLWTPKRRSHAQMPASNLTLALVARRKSWPRCPLPPSLSAVSVATLA